MLIKCQVWQHFCVDKNYKISQACFIMMLIVVYCAMVRLVWRVNGHTVSVSSLMCALIFTVHTRQNIIVLYYNVTLSHTQVFILEWRRCTAVYLASTTGEPCTLTLATTAGDAKDVLKFLYLVLKTWYRQMQEMNLIMRTCRRLLHYLLTESFESGKRWMQVQYSNFWSVNL